MRKFLTNILLFALIAVFASGCSWSKKDIDPKQKALTDYRESRERSALEIPPDLSSDASSTSLSVPAYKQKTTTAVSDDTVITPTVAPATSSTSTNNTDGEPGMYIERSGSQRWLVVDQSYAATWSAVRDFVLSSGLALEREDRDAGILETTWADNYATGVLRGSQNFFSKYIGSIYTSTSRDKFRIRVEPGRDKGTSEVYLSHKGMIEKIVEDTGVDPVATAWVSVPPDPSIEAEMLSLLMVKMGASETTAKTSIAKAEKSADRASITKTENGFPSLLVENQIDTAWRRVGQTLDRVGFNVEERNKSEWKYYVEYADPELEGKKPGFFSKMLGRGKNETEDNIYQILLAADGEKTRVDVFAREGSAAPEKVVTQIVKLLHEQLR